MTRILLIESASPERVREKALAVLESGIYPNPEITIVCRETSIPHYQSLAGVELYPLPARDRKGKGFPPQTFDVAYAFWTGEKEYRPLKLLIMRVNAKAKFILAGDGNEFRLNWKSMIKHPIFRFRHPLPSDHQRYVPQSYGKHGRAEKILIIQSAEPFYILQCLEQLRDKPMFRQPEYTLFCRNRREIAESLKNHPMLAHTITHSETRDSWRHLWRFRRERFDVVMVFLTGDPSYWKVKLFAFLLGGRHILIYNESCDCFFLGWSRLLALNISRLRGQPSAQANSRLGQSTRILVSLVLKSAVLPARFLWLLIVWLRLRIAGLRASRNSHDYSI